MATAPQASTVGESQSVSFSELQDLLLRIRTDEALYRQHMGKRFCTLLQQDGVKLYFNIEKKRKDSLGIDDRKDDKVCEWCLIPISVSSHATIGSHRLLLQYEYAMSARFKSPGSDGLITCKIASSILEPFFGVKPVSRCEVINDILGTCY
jgi:hypothetical protein